MFCMRSVASADCPDVWVWLHEIFSEDVLHLRFSGTQRGECKGLTDEGALGMFMLNARVKRL
jgi:hypothetical protein